MTLPTSFSFLSEVNLPIWMLISKAIWVVQTWTLSAGTFLPAGGQSKRELIVCPRQSICNQFAPAKYPIPGNILSFGNGILVLGYPQAGLCWGDVTCSVKRFENPVALAYQLALEPKPT